MGVTVRCHPKSRELGPVSISSEIPFLNPLGLGTKSVSLVTKAHLLEQKGREDMT